MSARDDGGPAFPITAEQHPNGISPAMGMTLRDYFAGQAMQAIVGSPNLPKGAPFEVIAVRAYTQADAMLKARAQ